MIFRAVILLFCAGLAGCLALPQTHVYKRSGDIRLSKSSGTELRVDLWTPTLDLKQQGEINPTTSFAIDKKGNRFKLIVKKIPYIEWHAIGKRTPFTLEGMLTELISRIIAQEKAPKATHLVFERRSDLPYTKIVPVA